MSGEANIQKWQETLGVISGFNKIEVTNDNVLANAADYSVSFTVDQLYIMLRELKQLLDPQSIIRLEKLIQKHIHEENAHGVSLELLSTTVVKEMYREWIIYKNRLLHNNSLTEAELEQRYSSEEFFKVIFQEARVADIPTTLLGVDSSKLVSPKGASTFIHKHNQDLEAHNVLIEHLFPGAVTEYTPTLSLIASGGLEAYVSVDNTHGILYMDASGKMRVSEQNFLPIDWSTGEPTYPIFGTCQNLCRYSSNFTHNLYTLHNVTISDSTVGTSIHNKNAATLSVVETDTVEDHYIKYTVPSPLLDNSKFLCVSLFAKADTISNLSINVYTETEDPYTDYRYSLANGDTFITVPKPDTIDGRVYNSPGMVRCTYICKTTPGTDHTVVIRPLDILDGDMTFKGSTSDKCYIFGLQIEVDKEVPSPYIDTEGDLTTREGTSAFIPLNQYDNHWYNPHQGSWFAKATNISSLTSTGSNTLEPRYIFDMRIKTIEQSAYALYYPLVSNGKVLAYYATTDGGFSHAITLPRETTNFIKSGLLYCNRGHIQRMRHTLDFPVGMSDAVISAGNRHQSTTKVFTDTNHDVSTNIDRLYIGCRVGGINQLNGYLSELIYYPAYASTDHIDFYTKG